MGGIQRKVRCLPDCGKRACRRCANGCGLLPTPPPSTLPKANAVGTAGEAWNKLAVLTTLPSTEPDWGRKPMSWGSTTRNENMTRPAQHYSGKQAITCVNEGL